MKRIVATCLSLLLAVNLVLPTQAQADSRTDQRLQTSQRVFESFVDLTEQSIPGWLLERAYGVVVVPNVVNAALTIGGRGGKGVMAIRHADGTWSLPTFVTLGGVNFGFQFGVQSTDVVLVLMSRQSVEGIAGGKVTLGADASVAAGPLGRSSAAATDATFSAQVLSYSRNSGLFVGVALDGASGVFFQVVVDAPAEPAVSPAPAVAPEPDPEPAQTYPLEDPNPGAPPPAD